ncbi:MAG: hypothetical protein NDP13_00465 [Crenarchaeota archaeon]|nr:hypothetical protein [Thermoproteota archaeon]MCR8453457.1 hypothetical protein [Thermoproteota archaeon]MCR8454898.1 hypothetical protein [Thermoproteota archaeon]MCR8462784.1 hypothetical protein [Thermoproteota archaeon]MCR8470521.1 hypothetical protein [Thermoproteota archaeon]
MKNFRILAKYRSQGRIFTLYKEIRALSINEALEKFYSLLGSQKIKRLDIKIIKVDEISPTELKNRKLQKIALSKDPVLYVEE